MVEIVETDLPGVGKRIALEKLAYGGKFVIVVHNDGRREIYYFRKAEDEKPIIFSLSDEEARKAGSVLSGAYFTPALVQAIAQTLTPKVSVEWVRVPLKSSVSGKTLGKLNLRKRLGVSAIAIVSGEKTIPNPSASFRLKDDDLLIVLGSTKGMERLRKLFSTKS
jgi:TrkA domain protein